MHSRPIEFIQAPSLQGPRSYFTDIDPLGKNQDVTNLMRKLKLQLLTKRYVVVAASSLFHDRSMDLLRDTGIEIALSNGIICPALRDEFGSVDDFFDGYKQPGFSDKGRAFYNEHVCVCVPWNLRENSKWFTETFMSHLRDADSPVREAGQISDDLSTQIDRALVARIDADKYLRREHVLEEVSRLAPDSLEAVTSFVQFLYRLSGSRVVNSDPHLPDSDAHRVAPFLTDDEIFWYYYIEAVQAL